MRCNYAYKNVFLPKWLFITTTKKREEKKGIRELENHTYEFRHQDFSFCPICGSLMPYSLNKIKNFFEVYNIHPSLKHALNLVYKSEFEAAAREAFVILETELRKKSGLDSHGFDLATKALKFEVGSKGGVVTKPPLIAINDLKTESDRNENGAEVKEALPADVPTLHARSGVWVATSTSFW